MSKSVSFKAFSMIEAIVGMIITAIVMGMIFVIFNMAGERLIDYREQGKLVNDMNRLTYSINKDIFESQQMSYSDELVFRTYPGEAVKYHFQQEYILRNAETFTDTFMVKPARIAIDSVKDKSGKLVFLKLKLAVEANEKLLALHFYKSVFANELLQNKTP